MAQPQPTISEEWTVTTVWLRNLLATAEQLGCNREPLLQELNLDHLDMSNLDQTVPLQYLDDLSRLIQKKTNKKNIGLHYVIQTPPNASGLLGLTAAAAPTLQKSLETIIRYRQLVMSVGNTRFFEGKGTRTMRWYPYSRAVVSSRFLVDAVVGGWAINSQRLSGRKVEPLQINLTYKDAEMTPLFREVYGDNVRLDQPYNSIVFSKEDWDCPLPYYNPKLFKTLCDCAEKEIKQLQSQITFAEKVEHQIKAQLPEGEATIQNIASRMLTTPRTLQRQLNKEGVVFKELLNNIRHELALSYLQDPSLSTLDIALKLGYNQASSFCTAFKNWTGISPSKYYDS